MIKINILDETERADLNVRSSTMKQKTISTPSSEKFKKIQLYVPIAAVVLFIAYFAYYLISIKGPLNKIKAEISSSEKKLKQLKPIVQKVKKSNDNLQKLNDTLEEYKNFVETKKPWAKILNIISNELPDEIIFTSTNIGTSEYSKKTRTSSGLKTIKISADILTINLLVNEEFQGKITDYVKKLKSHKYLKLILLEIQAGGLVLNKSNYVTNIKLIFKKNPNESIKNE